MSKLPPELKKAVARYLSRIEWSIWGNEWDFSKKEASAAKKFLGVKNVGFDYDMMNVVRKALEIKIDHSYFIDDDEV